MADPTAFLAASAPSLADLLIDWLPRQRWFAGKGHTLTDVVVTDAIPLRAADVRARRPTAGSDAAAPTAAASSDPRAHLGPAVEHLVVGVHIDGGSWQTYQVPVSVHEPGSVDDLGDLLLVGVLSDGRIVLDALSDPQAMTALLSGAADVPVLDPAETHGQEPEPGATQPPVLQATGIDHDWDRLPARRLTVEQSNTSIVLGDAAMAKVFRRLVPGKNPDIEVHAALLGNPNLGRCLGWVNGGWHDPETTQWQTGHLAMVQELLSPAEDGWELACRRVEEGTSFAEEARSLGAASASVHRELRDVFGTEQLSGDATHALIERLAGRLAEAAHLVPEVAELVVPLRARIEALGALAAPIEVQRVHGDYHLGQALLTRGGWKLLDFEGEPGAQVAARTAPDHALRDVAGMLRSFAYAAAQGGADRPPEQITAWRDECERAFLAGYASTASGRPGTSAESGDEEQILTAYLVDKAAYEAVYEKGNRPDWLSIPLTALALLAR